MADGHNSEGTVVVVGGGNTETLENVRILDMTESEAANAIFRLDFSEGDEQLYLLPGATAIYQCSAAPSSASRVCLAGDTKLLEIHHGDNNYLFFLSDAQFVWHEPEDNM